MMSEIEILIAEIKELCPNIAISQITSFGEKPFESGVWRCWNENDEDFYVNIEVHNGMLWAIYGSKIFENKYPIDATKICNFLNEN